MRSEDLTIQAIAKIVHVSTNVGRACEACREASVGLDRFAAGVNHYLEVHGYVLLHVGTETDQDEEGRPAHATVAVLGLPQGPAR